MKRQLWLFSITVIMSFAITFAQNSAVNVQKGSYIQDDANLLKQKEIDDINTLLETHNNNFIGRIFVRIISNLPNGKSINVYANDLINERPRLKNERLDRILILIDINEKQMRIETSRDVWKALPDQYCNKVIVEVIKPKFKKSDYYSGIKSGIESLISKLKQS